MPPTLFVPLILESATMLRDKTVWVDEIEYEAPAIAPTLFLPCMSALVKRTFLMEAFDVYPKRPALSRAFTLKFFIAISKLSFELPPSHGETMQSPMPSHSGRSYEPALLKFQD